MTALAAALTLGAALAAYVWAARRERARGRAWRGWRVASFAAGVTLLAAAAAPPLGAWAHHDPRGHVVRHLLLGMLAPLALVLAAPATLVLRALPVRAARRVTAVLRRPAAHRLAHPAAALALDVGALYLLYLTPLYALALRTPALHALVHLHFVVAGCLFAWATVGPDPAPRRPAAGVRLAAIGAAVAAHATLAKLMYAYGWPRGTPHGADELRAAAQLMYYGGDATELLLLVAFFWRRSR